MGGIERVKEDGFPLTVVIHFLPRSRELSFLGSVQYQGLTSFTDPHHMSMNNRDFEDFDLPSVTGESCCYCGREASGVSRGSLPILSLKYLSLDERKKFHFTCEKCRGLEIEVLGKLLEENPDRSEEAIDVIVRKARAEVLNTASAG